MNTELVTIGIALLGIILGTWFYLRSITKKLDKLLILLTRKPLENKEDSTHTDSVQSNQQHGFAYTVGSYVKDFLYNLRGKINFYYKEKYQFNNIHQEHYTTKQPRLIRTVLLLT